MGRMVRLTFARCDAHFPSFRPISVDALPDIWTTVGFFTDLNRLVAPGTQIRARLDMEVLIINIYQPRQGDCLPTLRPDDKALLCLSLLSPKIACTLL